MPIAEEVTRPLFEFTLAPLSEDHGVPLAIMGVLVVFLALTLVASFIALLPRVLARVATARSKPATISLPVTDEELSEETLVIIAAAVAATIRGPHRIVRVRGLTPEELGWSLEGRMQHHQSHRIQRRHRR